MGFSGEPIRVLFVGDGPETEALADGVRAEDGFAVTVADEADALDRSAADAFDRSAADAFDCVVGDADDGLELLDAVRDRWPNVPYVFVADDGEDAAEQALERGATDYLERRGDRDRSALLARRVENAVARRTARGAVGALADGEHARIAAELRENETYLRKLYRIASNADLGFERKRRRLLEVGRERLDVDVGFVSRIEGETFEIVDAVGSHELLRPGRTAPLGRTYCRKTLDADGLLSVEDAASEGWVGDPAYETYGLGCYVGAKVFVDGDLYGTLCFADRDPRERSFSEHEKIYVELISQWLRYELERRADERALREQNQRLEEFASVVSHDLRNPLNVAQIYLTRAEETGADADFEQVRDAHDRMERLIENLLTLAHDGDVAADVSDCDLSAVAADAWENVEAPDATLRTEGERTLAADCERLQQLLENLFRNAVEHGSTSRQSSTDDAVEHGSTSNRPPADDAVEHGSMNPRPPDEDAVEHGGDVTVRVGPLDGREGFYVADDGPGIPEDRRESIFDHGYSTSDGGTGLGLAIVERVADAHDWTVSVGESETGGARFEVECDPE